MKGFKLNWLVMTTSLVLLEMLIFAFINPKVSIAQLPILALLLFFSLKSENEIEPPQIWPSLLDLETKPRRGIWRKILREVPIGIAVVESGGKIRWENKAFVDMVRDQKPAAHLEDLLPPETVEELLNGGEAERVEIGDNTFWILGCSLVEGNKETDQTLKALFFKDLTRSLALERELEEEKGAISYIQIDNFDEIVAACPEEHRPELLAKIDKAIAQWVHGLGGFTRKYSSDKFVAVFSLRDFRRAEESKFDILEAVREIKAGPSMNVTLSIGAAYGPSGFAQINTAAQSALELCLGRGGDQVVVKADGKTNFYGGKTKEMEKYSRVRARVISHALAGLIEESDVVVAMGHQFLDMDALGASLGIVSAAKALGKPSFAVLCPGQNPSVDSLLEFLAGDDDVKGTFLDEQEVLDKITKKSLLVVVDTHRPSFSLSTKVLEKAERVVVIDHHRRGEEFIDKAMLVYLEPYASSTGEMVTEMLQYIREDVKIPSSVATALMAGIAVDTRNFSFKTGVRTFEAASYLRRAGADPTIVHKLLQEDLVTLNLRAEVVKRAEEVFDHIALSYYDEKPKNPALSAAQAANSLLEIRGILASFVLVPTDDGISISGRSLGNVNVQRVLEKLGGGGHMTVAGAQLEDIGMEEAIDKVKEAILEYVKEGEAT
jgi:c-di-AMP phosphodiesterase-like protein